MLINLLVNFVPIILAITLHEIAHGFVAYLCGDDTAYRYRRLSLNPIRHIDLYGTIIVPAVLFLSQIGFMFGWAKPVPVNYHNLRNPRTDIIFVASAGILMNLFLAFISGLLIKILPPSAAEISIICKVFLFNMVMFNVVLAVFNILPIPPLDGSKILLGWSSSYKIQRFLGYEKQGLFFLITLIFFIPEFARLLGYNFNPFGLYIIKVSKYLSELFI